MKYLKCVLHLRKKNLFAVQTAVSLPHLFSLIFYKRSTIKNINACTGAHTHTHKKLRIQPRTTWILLILFISFAFKAIQPLHSIKNVTRKPLLYWKIDPSHDACLDYKKSTFITRTFKQEARLMFYLKMLRKIYQKNISA